MRDGDDGRSGGGEAGGAGGEEGDAAGEVAQGWEGVVGVLGEGEEEFAADILGPAAGEGVVAVGDEGVVGLEVEDLNFRLWGLVGLRFVFVIVLGSAVGGALGLFVAGLDGVGDFLAAALFVFVSEGYGGGAPELALMAPEAGVYPFGLGACTAAGRRGGLRTRSWYGWSCEIEREVERLRGGKQV